MYYLRPPALAILRFKQYVFPFLVLETIQQLLVASFLQAG